ncbi:MAG: cyanophycinase [Gemmatimonadaceae bacterium]
MSRGRTGTLVIIGGHENKDDDPLILKEVVRRVDGGKLVVATVASDVPEETWNDYERVFRRLGVKHLYKLDVETREDACSDRKVQILSGADAVFFTGGDQLKITNLLGASPICERLREIYHEGGMICGTSAGASVMSDTMLVGGGDDGSARIGRTVRMAPGLALVSDVLIDQHFAERGRVGRLLGAVAQNPRLLGIGIDENTAVVMTGGRRFHVLGEGAVYAFNAWDLTYANLTEESRDRALSMFGTRVDVLSQGDSYDLATRVPTNHPAREIEEQLESA